MVTEVPGSPVGTADEVEAPRFYFGYYLVGAAFIAQFVSVGAQNYIIGVFLTPMTADLGWTRPEFVIARTIGQVAMAVIGLFIGGYVDRAGGRRLMTIGTVILGASLFAMSYVQDLWQWWLLNGIALTVGSAMVGNLVVNITLSKWFVEKRGRMIGTASMGVSSAGVVLPFLMTGVVEEWGWRAGWRFASIGAMVLLFPIAALMRRAPEDYGLNPDGLTASQIAAGGGKLAQADFAHSITRRQARRMPQFYLLVLAFGMFTVSITVMLINTIPFMEDAGYSSQRASLMITVTSIPALVSKPIWGIFMDRAEPKRLVSFSATATGGALMLIVYSVSAGIEWLVPISFVLLGSGWGGLIPLQETTWASYFGRRYIGAVRSAGLPFSIALGALGPLVANFYYDAVGNYNGAFITVGISCLVSAVLILFVRRPDRSAFGAPPA